jgi:thiol reductant ABC exporter CydC subunit
MRDLIRLTKLILPSWQIVAVAGMMGFFTVSSNVGLMAASAYLIASAALHPPVLDLMTAIVGVRFFGIARAVFRYLERYVTHDVTFRALSRLRTGFYTVIEPLAPARLMEYRSGDMLSRYVADVESLQYFYLRVIAPALVALLSFFGILSFLVWFNWQLACLWAVFFLAAAVAVPLGLAFLSKGHGGKITEAKASLTAHIADSFRGMAEMITYGSHQIQLQSVGNASRAMATEQAQVARLNALAGAVTSSLMNGALWAMLVLTIYLTNRGHLDALYIAMLALVAYSSFEAVTPLGLVHYYLEESLSAARRLRSITDASPVVMDPPEPTVHPKDYRLEVQDVWFRYHPQGKWVLSGVNFSVPQGKTIAIVGASGTGKSTILNLLLRFWEYQEGSICLGGVELRSYAQEFLRAQIGVVQQHTHLFNTTIRGNLMMAKPDAGEKELIEATQKARLYEFIQSLPQGFDTYIGESGFKLSGGQRQRVAIARALLKDAPILVLDEATAGLDPVTEREVMQDIYDCAKGRTALVITHRLVALEAMDEILVLDQGRIIERGGMAELLAQDGVFRQMWELQRAI